MTVINIHRSISHFVSLTENVVLAGDILFLQIVECLKVSNAHTNLFDFELCDNSQ